MSASSDKEDFGVECASITSISLGLWGNNFVDSVQNSQDGSSMPFSALRTDARDFFRNKNRQNRSARLVEPKMPYCPLSLLMISPFSSATINSASNSLIPSACAVSWIVSWYVFPSIIATTPISERGLLSLWQAVGSLLHPINGDNRVVLLCVCTVPPTPKAVPHLGFAPRCIGHKPAPKFLPQIFGLKHSRTTALRFCNGARNRIPSLMIL